MWIAFLLQMNKTEISQMFVTSRQLKQEGVSKFPWSLWTRKPFSEGHKFLVEENKKFSTQSNSIVSKQRSNVTMWCCLWTSKYILGYHAVNLGFIEADKPPLPSWSYQSMFPNWVNANSEILFSFFFVSMFVQVTMLFSLFLFFLAFFLLFLWLLYRAVESRCTLRQLNSVLSLHSRLL